MGAGSLQVVGTGYLIAGHATPQAVAAMRRADKLFHLVGDALTRAWIESLNRSAESLQDTYAIDKARSLSYQEMVERILAAVRSGLDVCAAFYGHPGVMAIPSHAAILQARREGYDAWMLPAISAADCLYADLGVDPGANGCQSFEASDFLLRNRRFDPTSALLLWQIGGIGVETLPDAPCNRNGLAVLCEALKEHYPIHHELVIYEAADLPVCDPRIVRCPLAGLADAEVTLASTLYVPPLANRPIDPLMRDRLKLSPPP
jgi:uncharacterized protein YabN with tetrapyrrole methylase and pyrophosphatase domain